MLRKTLMAALAVVMLPFALSGCTMYEPGANPNPWVVIGGSDARNRAEQGLVHRIQQAVKSGPLKRALVRTAMDGGGEFSAPGLNIGNAEVRVSSGQSYLDDPVTTCHDFSVKGTAEYYSSASGGIKRRPVTETVRGTVCTNGLVQTE